nr:uncharacterized protein LOC109167327 [Ipomoea batatas]
MAASSSSTSSNHSNPTNDQLTLKEICTKRILKYLEDAGLMTYVTLNYKTTVHNLDVTEFFANARLSKKKNDVRLRVNGRDVVIAHGDIRALFEFSVRERQHPDYSGHTYNKEALWKKVKGD